MMCSFCGKDHEGICSERTRIMNKAIKTNLAKTDRPACVICGKVSKFSSKKFGHLCSDSCYEIAQRGDDPSVPHVVKNRKGDLHFMQGDVRFPIDYDLDKTLGAGRYGHEPSCLDKLMDSQLVQFAQLNHITVDPFVRFLVESPLRGIVQLTWYRDLNVAHDDLYLVKNQENRIKLYERQLKEYQPGEDGIGRKKGQKVTAKQETMHKSFKTKTGHFKLSSGRERQLFEVIYNLSDKGKKAVPFPQIVEAAKQKVKTKQDIEKITIRFLKVLLEAGSVEEVR